jgi:hypothetical protein
MAALNAFLEGLWIFGFTAFGLFLLLMGIGGLIYLVEDGEADGLWALPMLAVSASIFWMLAHSS